MTKFLRKAGKTNAYSGFANRLLITLIAFVATNSAYAAVTVSSNVAANTTWTLANSPYTIASNITINGGVTLTIEPGVEVKFNDNMSLTVLGTLNAGTAVATNTVNFTTSSASPLAGKWNRITVGSSTISGTANLNNCNILYGSYGVYIEKGTATIVNTSISNITNDAIYVGDGDNLTLTNGTISGVGRGVYAVNPNNITSSNTNINKTTIEGIYIQGSTATTAVSLDKVAVSETTSYGIWANYTVNVGTLSITNLSSFINTKTNAIRLTNVKTGTFNKVSSSNSLAGYTNTAALYVEGPTTLSLTDVTLANATYPVELKTQGTTGAPKLTYAGTNNFTSNNTFKVVYINDSRLDFGTLQLDSLAIPYYFNQTFTVVQNATLKVSSGNTLKFADNTSLEVGGILTAEAKKGGNLYFTSFKDDNLGGDSNNDANQSAPVGKVSQSWYGIQFTNTSSNTSVLKRSTVKFAGYRQGATPTHRGAVTVTNSAPTIDLNLFNNSAFGAVFVGSASPVFTNNTIASSDLTPIAMSFEANPTFTNNIFSSSDNTYDAIGLLGGTLVADANLIKRNFTSLPNVTYLMLDDIIIPTGRRLTIEAGVVIKSASGRSIFVVGNITAIGTEASPIVFTSVSDDNYGNPLDTQKNGTNVVPTRSDFGAISFLPGSGATSEIKYTTLKFSNGRALNISSYITAPSRNIEGLAPIQVVGSSPVIQNNTISEVNVGIASYLSATPTIRDNNVSNTAKAPFALSASSNPTFVGNTFTSVGWKALGIIDEDVTINSTIKQRTVGGLTNISYVMLNNLTVATGSNLTIDPGVIIKFVAANTRIFVNGGLHVKGTAASLVTLTSLADDNAGASAVAADNDTQGNGNATKPAPGDWGGITFNNSSDDAFSKIEYADILYAGTNHSGSNIAQNAAIIIDGASPSFLNLNINQAAGFGFNFNGVSNPILQGVTIRNCGQDPFAMGLFSDPTFTNITLVQNGSNGIRIIDTNIGAAATIKQRSFAGIANVAYISSGNMVVESNGSLTINPGVVIKFAQANGDYNWNLKGKMTAVGTIAEPIYFTSIKDDSRGGDTNIDGNNSVPAAGNWNSLEFSSTSVGSQIKNAEIRYAYIAVESNGSNVVIDNNVIELVTQYALDTRNKATTTFTNNKLRNIGFTPIIMSPFDTPVSLAGNTIQNVGLVGISLWAETMSQSATLPQRDFAGYTNITYILTDATYQTSGSPSFNINEGTELTILAGTVFKKKGGQQAIAVNGKLKVNGTAGSPVIFTAIADDKYGNPLDTEQNGTLTTPGFNTGQNQSADWVYFAPISDDASVIDNALFRYTNSDVIEVNSASPTITNSTFELSDYGIRNTGVSSPIINNNTFKDLRSAPLTISLVAYPASTLNNKILGTTWKGIEVNNETLTQDLTLPKRSFGGIANIPYIYNTYRVGPGVTLTFAPGVVNKFNNYGGITVDGALKAVGAADNQSTIVFTSLYDDFYGGDTNSDTTFSIVNNQPGWYGITYENTSMDDKSILDYTIFRHAKQSNNGAVKLISASPTISNSIFDNNYFGLFITGASKPTLTKNDFIRNSQFGINNTGSFEVDAKNSWWGHNSGPFHATLNAEGLGDKVSSNVLFNPWGTQGSLNPLAGDVSLNGSVTAFDASLVLQAAVSSITLTAKQAEVADVSGSAGVSALDAAHILQYAAKKIQYFPSESTNKRVQKKEPFAPTASAVEVKLQDVNLVEGTTKVTVPVMLENIAALHALEASLNYDTKVLKFIGVEKAGIGTTLNLADNHNPASGKIAFAFAQAEALKAPGTLVNLQFEVLNTTVAYAYVEINKIIGNETDVTKLASASRITINTKAAALEEILAEKGLQAYPNPALDKVNLDFGLKTDGKVNIVLYNNLGQKVRELVNSDMSAGKTSVSFSRDELAVKPGIYFLKGTVGGKALTQQVILQ